ncbi:fimbria/pilus periplasmic chaperone [Pseudescherichia vulneris]
MKLNFSSVATGLLLSLIGVQQANAAIALDRTRVIYNGDSKSVSLNISNQNQKLPYLAQGWLEDANGNKINSPLTVLPPVQRIEPGAKSQVKVQALLAANTLAQDKETLFYFNLREIPPKSKTPNTLQLALQTRIKLFYRPAAITPAKNDVWQEKLTLAKQGDGYLATNPTPYYITIVAVSSTAKGESLQGFEPFMVPPKGTAKVTGNAPGSTPVLTFVNDYGGRQKLAYSCGGASCTSKLLSDN